MIKIDVTGSPILVRNKLSEMQLSHYLEFMEARQKESEILRSMEFLQFDIEMAFGVNNLHEVTEEQVKENPEEYQRLFDEISDLIISKLFLLTQQLQALCMDEVSKKEVENIPENMLVYYVGQLELDVSEEYEAGASVHIPGVNNDQIHDMESEIKELDPEREGNKIFAYQKRLALLKKHVLVLKDVRDAIFASYMRASSIEQAVPQQDKESFTALEEANLDAREYEKNRQTYLSNAQTPKERKELRDRDLLVRTFLNSSEINFIKRIPELLSLFLLPEGEEFSMHYAKKREAYIKELSMDQLFGLINFIEAVLTESRINTAEFSLDQLKMLSSKTSRDLLLNGLTTLESMGGSRPSEMFY